MGVFKIDLTVGTQYNILLICFYPIWRHGDPYLRRRRQPVEAQQRVRQNYQKQV